MNTIQCVVVPHCGTYKVISNTLIKVNKWTICYRLPIEVIVNCYY